MTPNKKSWIFVNAGKIFAWQQNLRSYILTLMSKSNLRSKFNKGVAFDANTIPSSFVLFLVDFFMGINLFQDFILIIYFLLTPILKLIIFMFDQYAFLGYTGKFCSWSTGATDTEEIKIWTRICIRYRPSYYCCNAYLQRSNWKSLWWWTKDKLYTHKAHRK